MAIPLVGSPPPADKNYKDLITGDSYDFDTVGSWVATGGGVTLTSSASYALPQRTKSLKVATTLINGGAMLTITHPFRTDREYQLLLTYHVEDVTLTGSDPNIYYTVSISGNNGSTTGMGDMRITPTLGYVNSASSSFGAKGIVWRPDIAHSSATIAVWISSSSSGSYNASLYLGSVRLVEVLQPGDPGIIIEALPGTSSYRGSDIWSGPVVWSIGDQDSGAQLGLSDYEAYMFSDTNRLSSVGITSGGPTGNSTGYMWAEHETGYSQLGGLNLEAGVDYVGVQMFQADTDTLALQADSRAGYHMKLLDRGSLGLGWSAESRGGGRSVMLSKAVENPMTAEDDIIVSTTTGYSTSNRDYRANSAWNIGGGGAEATSAGMTVSCEWPIIATTPITVDYDVWYSHYSQASPTASKSTTIRLRRTNVTGTQLATQTSADTSNSLAGHSFHFSGTYTDSSPTDGVYCITVDNATAYVMADTRILTASTTGAGAPTRLAKGNNNDILTISPTTGHVSWQAPGLVSVSSPTGSYTLQLTDAGKVVELDSGSSSTLTIPANGTTQFPVGTTIGVYQAGAGQITVSPTGAATLRAAAGTKTRAQYSAATLRKRATDEWVLSGDVTV